MADHINEMVDNFNEMVHNKLLNRSVVPHHPRRVRRNIGINPAWTDAQNRLFQEVYSSSQLRVSENNNTPDNEIHSKAMVLLDLFRQNIWPF